MQFFGVAWQCLMQIKNLDCFRSKFVWKHWKTKNLARSVINLELHKVHVLSPFEKNILTCHINSFNIFYCYFFFVSMSNGSSHNTTFLLHSLFIECLILLSKSILDRSNLKKQMFRIVKQMHHLNGYCLVSNSLETFFWHSITVFFGLLLTPIERLNLLNVPNTNLWEKISLAFSQNIFITKMQKTQKNAENNSLLFLSVLNINFCELFQNELFKTYLICTLFQIKNKDKISLQILISTLSHFSISDF